jgi:hypothetical protein
LMCQREQRREKFGRQNGIEKELPFSYSVWSNSRKRVDLSRLNFVTSDGWDLSKVLSEFLGNLLVGISV